MTAPASMDARVLEGLGNLRRLLAAPRRWTQGAAARDGRGGEVASTAPQACRWCLTGGVRKVTVDAGNGWAAEPQMLLALQRHMPPAWERPVRLAEFNDYPDTTHADVLDLVDRTIRDLTNGTVGS